MEPLAWRPACSNRWSRARSKCLPNSSNAALKPEGRAAGAPGTCLGAATIGRRSRSFSAPAERVELGVGARTGEIGQTIRHAEEGGDRRDVPDVLIAAPSERADRPQRAL